MGTKTDFEVQCRCGAWVPLLQMGNSAGTKRFYMGHGGRSGCTTFEKYDCSVDNPEDLADPNGPYKAQPLKIRKTEAPAPAAAAVASSLIIEETPTKAEKPQETPLEDKGESDGKPKFRISW